MIRIKISLDATEYHLVKAEAKALGIPMAEFVRRAIRHGLPAENQSPWMRYAGFVESGNSRSSQTVDEV